MDRGEKLRYKIKQNGDSLLESVYKNRNLTDDYIDSLLYSDTWEEPESYKNMNEGYKLLKKTIEKEGDIGIVVDPDVDGYMSAAIITSFIYDDLKYDNVWYIIKKENPKSHGINKEIIDKVKENKFDLLILPDGGSTDYKYQKEIIDMGCEILITDHHLFDTSINTGAVIINNNDNQVKNKNLSGAGVTFKFCYYYAQQEGIDLKYKYLDLVALSLISDMMEMREEENRYLFNLGCQKENISNKLMKSFVKDLKIKNKISIEQYGFSIAPLLNAIIRMDKKGDEKEKLMEALLNSVEEVNYRYRSKDMTQSIQDSILRVSRRFKNNQKTLVEKTMKDIGILNNKNNKIIIINGNNIQPEIRGLVCNKLVNEYKKPVMILSGEDILQGSARGINSINLKGLCEKSKLVVYAEGHENSFGLGISKENISDFIQFINNELADVDMENYIEVDYVYDKFIPLDDVLSLGGDLEDLWDNRTLTRPKILIKNMTIDSNEIKKYGINLTYKDDKGICYKRDFCSKVLYERLICKKENPHCDKMLNVDMICEVKTNESNFSYLNIVDFESSIKQS